MSARYTVRFDPVALAALEETATYIEDESGPDRAGRWLEAMRLSIQRLESTPRAFPVACIRRGRPIHSKLVQTHRVYYFIDPAERLVYIVDVVHTARERNWPSTETMTRADVGNCRSTNFQLSQVARYRSSASAGGEAEGTEGQAPGP